MDIRTKENVFYSLKKSADGKEIKILNMCSILERTV